jgi:hypothetical protein
MRDASVVQHSFLHFNVLLRAIIFIGLCTKQLFMQVTLVIPCEDLLDKLKPYQLSHIYDLHDELTMLLLLHFNDICLACQLSRRCLVASYS